MGFPCIYEMKPLKPTRGYVSEFAPTSELGGLVKCSAGAMQYVVPDRGSWAPSVRVRTIGN
ncbi:hypothetical protein PsdCFBP2356_14470 [Pseudomonas syringae pv. dysoxyli]|nr:hypothetical protein [Pseudomonas syringae pv. dysoxyli]